MKCLQVMWQRGKYFFFAMVCWLAVHGSVFAQPAQKKEESGGGSYVMPYALVIFTIALGMMAVLRPSRRRDRAKPEVYDEVKIAAPD